MKIYVLPERDNTLLPLQQLPDPPWSMQLRHLLAISAYRSDGGGTRRVLHPACLGLMLHPPHAVRLALRFHVLWNSLRCHSRTISHCSSVRDTGVLGAMAKLGCGWVDQVSYPRYLFLLACRTRRYYRRVIQYRNIFQQPQGNRTNRRKTDIDISPAVASSTARAKGRATKQ